MLTLPRVRGAARAHEGRTGGDLVCLSHLRWNFVFQRPQHLLSRFGRAGRVFFVEEPIHTDTPAPRLHIEPGAPGVLVCVPHLPHGWTEETARAAKEGMLSELFSEHAISHPVLWYYTPSAMAFTRHLPASAVVYDCMDELSAFKDAPADLRFWEAELFRKADLVFTGGHSLYEAKKDAHPHVHAFPSSIDFEHFARARRCDAAHEPADQRDLPGPRFGFFGVLDERFDCALIESVARARPDWHFVMIGPVVKIDPATLPRHPNIHYLGGKSYAQLPEYVAGWDVALLPFARNASTRFISPTKTPEYLAAGKSVISTPIQDVVDPYGLRGFVRIAEDAHAFLVAGEAALAEARAGCPARRARVDAFLAQTSWDKTWSEMDALLSVARARKDAHSSVASFPSVLKAQ